MGTATVTELFSSFDSGDGSSPTRTRGFLIDAPTFLASLDATTDSGSFPRVGDADTASPELNMVCVDRSFRTTGDGSQTFAQCFYTRPGEVWPTKDNRGDGYKVEAGLSRIGIVRQPQIYSQQVPVGDFFPSVTFEYEATWTEFIIPEQVYEVSVNISNWSMALLSVISGQTGKIHTFGTAPNDKWLFQGGQFRHTRATSGTEFITQINYRWIGRSKIDAIPGDPAPLTSGYLEIPELPPFHEYRIAGNSTGGLNGEPIIRTYQPYTDGDATALPGAPVGGPPPP